MRRSGPNATVLVTAADDPTETWPAQDFRSAKASFVPSRKRDIVSFYCMDTTPGGRVTWQSASDDENSLSRLAGQQLRGRSRRVRSKASGYGASASSCPQ